MGIWLRRSTWNSLVILSIPITHIMFASLRKLYTVWNKLYGLGSTTLVVFFCLMGLCVAMLIPLCLLFALVPIFWFSFFMWMTLFWLVVPLHFFIPLSPFCLTSLRWKTFEIFIISLVFKFPVHPPEFSFHSKNMLLTSFTNSISTLPNLLPLPLLPALPYPWLAVNSLQMLLNTEAW